jgi:WXG100 family type VII secretion target
MKIVADTGQIRQVAKDVDGKRQLFDQQVAQVKSIASDLQAVWTGTDHDQYVAKITGFESELQKLSSALQGYVQALNDAAQKYETAQDSIAQGTSRLA